MRILRSQRLSAGPAGRQVYRALREAIVAAELEPGQRISENELTVRLGVSRTPIREALARLRDERFVQVIPQLGTYVTRISTAAVEDAQFVREALECAAVRIAAQRATTADIAALEGLVRRQEEVVANDDFERFAVRRRVSRRDLRAQWARVRLGGGAACEGTPQPRPPAQPSPAELSLGDGRRASRGARRAAPQLTR